MLKALSLLIKPASGNCQLRCKYCFYRNVTESREVTSYGVMNLDTLNALVSHAILETDEACTFSFQGGEPTLAGLDFYRELVSLQDEYCSKYHKKSLVINNVIQTNGLLINDDWCDFFVKNHFLVGLSLDGDKAIHDANRIDASGKGTFNRVMRAARTMDRHRVEYNILCVITQDLARHARHIYQTLVRNGFRYLQFIPCIDDFGTPPGSSHYSLTADRYAEFLEILFDEWYKDFINGKYISIRHFDNWIRMMQGSPPDTCSMSGVCTCYGVVEADGSVYPCDFYVLDQWRLGTIQAKTFEEMLSGEKAEAFVQASRLIARKCRECHFYAICRGGCRRDREPLNLSEDPNQGLNVYCEAYKQFFKYSLNYMKQVANLVS